ncbi:condensation domain-containing protein [Roseibium aggregatum]|uniref:condensation domain-containing protein n=1 Tax=Roseibium aggregatum TaxID=187304 RepID=UPI003A974129
MTGGFDRLLTESELERLDEALKTQEDHDQFGGETVPLSEKWSPLDAVEVTQHQERIWLAQQQDPALQLRHALAYRLGGSPEIARLTRAVDSVTEALPELTMRYRFSDDGELLKHPTAECGETLEVVNVDSRQEAIALILARQQAPWASETEPPFIALVMFCPHEVILALIMHRIVEEMCTPEDVLANIARAYDRKSFIAPSQNVPTELTLEANDIAPVVWLRGAQTTGRIVDFGVPSSCPVATGSLAHRYGTVIETHALPVLQHPVPDIQTLLASLGTRFASFLCGLGAQEGIVASFPEQPEARLGDHSAGFAFGDTIDVLIEADAELRGAEIEVLNRLRSGVVSVPTNEKTSPEQMPKVSIRWLTEPRRFFEARTVVLERVPLPTPEIRPDFELAVGLDAEDRVVLELVTGQRIARHAGALVLDLFVGQLTGEVAGKAEGNYSSGLHYSLANAECPSMIARNLAAPQESDGAAIRTAILQEFREALATPELGVDDDFFDFGGHSLVATRIIGRLLHNHGIEVRFNDLFGNPTAAALARHARIVADAKKSVGNGSVEIHTGDSGTAIAPLALAQMSLWKIYSAFGYSEIFNLPFALDFLDPVDETVFEEAFRDLIKRHSALRTLFFEDEQGDVFQKVVPVEELQNYQWFWGSEESTNTDRNTEAGYRFDLARELPVRLRFLKDKATGRQMLSFLFQHLALDEWSVNLMMDELVEAYRARASGAVPVWSGDPKPFHDFARKQVKAGVNGEHLSYWTDMLIDAPRELVLFPDLPAATEPEDTVAGSWVEMRLKKDVSEGLYALAKDNSASLFNVVYGAISAALQKLGGLTDLVIGTSASGRTDPDYFDTVGYFTTVVAHRVRFNDGQTVGGLVRDIKELINGSMPYQDIPIDLVETALGMTPGRDHLFDVFIQIHAQNKLNGNLPTPDGGRIAFRQVDPDKHESHLGLQFEVMEEVIDGDRSIRVLMSYQAKRYAPAQVEAIRETVMEMYELFAASGASDRKLLKTNRV